jgi:interferon-induced transmembrane protein
MSQQYGSPSPSGEIPNYLVPAILSRVFCCLPLGVVSIIFATQVNSKIATGDTAGAMESSKKAKMFMMIAIGLGALSWIIAVVCWIFVFGMAAVSNM